MRVNLMQKQVMIWLDAASSDRDLVFKALRINPENMSLKQESDFNQ